VSGDGQARVADAVDWYLKNESGQALDSKTLFHWELWYRELHNRNEYLSLVRMGREARRMPAPTLPTGAQLIADIKKHLEDSE
jgi:hypothetical protein